MSDTESRCKEPEVKEAELQGRLDNEIIGNLLALYSSHISEILRSELSRFADDQKVDHSPLPASGDFWDSIPGLCGILNAEIERNLVLSSLSMPVDIEQRFHAINQMLGDIVWHLERMGSSNPSALAGGDVVQFPRAGSSSCSPEQLSLGIQEGKFGYH